MENELAITMAATAILESADAQATLLDLDGAGVWDALFNALAYSIAKLSATEEVAIETATNFGEGLATAVRQHLDALKQEQRKPS